MSRIYEFVVCFFGIKLIMVSVSLALVEGWLPFVAILLFILVFSTIYVRHFMSKYDSECSSTLAAVLGLSTALVTSSLVPVDIFLVSYMKDSSGNFREWANNSSIRDMVEQSVLISYYVMYGLMTFFFFLFLPFMYFFFEEKDDVEQPSTASRCCGALKYTIVFVFIASVLLILGAFLPKRDIVPSNETDWQKIDDLFKSLGDNRGEDALSFLISTLSLIGMLAIITYTSYGMSAMPIRLIQGYRSISHERNTAAQVRVNATERIQAIKDRYTGRRTMSSRDRTRIAELEENRRFVERQERHLAEEQNSCLRKCLLVFRPFEIFIGCFFLLIALLIFLSLLLTNIDKAMNSLGFKMGYALPKRTLPNPIDMVLVFSQKAYPLDYIIMVFIIIYLVFCSISGIRNLGIWFFCVRLYKIRPHRTNPQGMLMLSMIMMLIVVAINIVLFELTPQYSSFGSELYLNTTVNLDANGTVTKHLYPCDVSASSDQCVITRMAMLLTRFFHKMWFFGAAYYWSSWLFLALIPIGFIAVIVRRRRSAIEGAVEEDDFEESDDDLIRA